MIILDTDVFSFLELPDSPEYTCLRARIAQLDPPQPVQTTVITYEEQARGRLAMVTSARTDRQLATAYTHLRQHVLNYRQIPIAEFTPEAAAIATALRRSKLRIATMDLRIAAIALVNRALLLSRNLSDFGKVPNLRVEDWTKP